MENLLKLSASGLCRFSLAEAKQKPVCVCVCEMQDNKLCLYWGKSWILQRKWHQPLQYGCNPNSWLCQRVLGRNCSPSPFNTVISNCWSTE